jgi:hypothetical protein
MQKSIMLIVMDRKDSAARPANYLRRTEKSDEPDVKNESITICLNET